MRQSLKNSGSGVIWVLSGAILYLMAMASLTLAQTSCLTPQGTCGGPCVGEAGNPGLCMADAANGECACIVPAPRFDHLKCYEAKDEIKVDNEFIARALQEQFGVEKCRIHGRRRLFCIPVSKERVFPPAAEEGLFDDVPMTPLPDRICYQVSCEWDKRKQEVTDQFGNRTLVLGQPQWFCTPAIKGPPPPPECGLIGRQCGGACDAGFTCRSSAGTADCSCLPDSLTEP